jgi:hypothetical protein
MPLIKGKQIADASITQAKLDLADPVAPLEAATKQYVDNLADDKINGTIAAGEVAFGTAVDTIGGEPALTWDASNKTLAVTGVGPALTISNDVSGQFASFEAGSNSLDFTDPDGSSAVAMISAVNGFTVGDGGTFATNVTSNQVLVEQVGLTLSSAVTPGVLTLNDNLQQVALSAAAAAILLKGDSALPTVPTITAKDFDDSLTKLNLQLGELQVNGSAGNAGQVLTSNGTGSAPTWEDSSGGIAGTIAATEIAFGTGVDSIGGDSRLTWNTATGDLAITDSGSANTITLHTSPWPLIESTDSMNINIANNAGALGLQTGGNDLVLIGGDDGSGNAYLQSQNAVRIESRGPLVVTDYDGSHVSTLRAQDNAAAAAPLNLELSELQVNGASGNAGQILTSNGAGLAPTWEDASGGSTSPLKNAVVVKYDFAGGLNPDVPALPSEPAVPTFGGTVHTVTTEAELSSALTAAVDGDIIEIPSATTITLTSSKTINKSLEIRGQSKATSVITASFAVSANSGLLIVSGTKSGGAQNNNVYIHDLTITTTNNTTDHSCILANTISSSFNNGSTGLRFENLNVNTTEFGIVVGGDSWVVKGCTFAYVPSTGAADTARHLGVYNISTIGWVENNDFQCTTEATPRTICMLLTASDYEFAPATKSGGYAGDFVVKGNTQSSGNLRQWLVMESFKANGLNSAPMPLNGFSLWLVNNTHGNSSGGSVILYEGSGTKAPLDFFNVLYASNNNVGESTGTDKGFIAVDGLGSARSGGAPSAMYVSLANFGTAVTAALGGTYVQGCTDDNGTGLSPAQGNVLAINSTFFNSPSPASRVSLQEPTSGGPVVPSGLSTVDGVALSADDRVLVIDAYNGVYSGIYTAAVGDWPRASDFASGSDAASTFMFVQKGDDYADTCWLCTNDSGSDVVGTDSLSFSQFGASGSSYTAGDGLQLVSNEFSVADEGITETMLADSAVTQVKLSLVDPVSALQAATKQYVDNSIPAVCTYHVNTSGSDLTGNGSLAAPFASLQAAHDKALVDYPLAGINTVNVQIVVAPGKYAGNLAVTRSNTHFVSLSQSPDLKSVELNGNVSIDCSAALFVYEEIVSFTGFLVNPSSASTVASVLITGTGIFSTIFDNCFINSSSTNVNAHAIHCNNTAATRPIIRLTRCIVHAERSANNALLAERGDWRVSLCALDSQASPAVGTKNCVLLQNNATFTGAYNLIESANNAATISMTGTMPGSTKFSMSWSTIVNSCTVVLSHGLSIDASGLSALCSNSFFAVTETSATTFAVTGVAGSFAAIPNCNYATNTNINSVVVGIVAVRGDLAGGDLTGRYPIPTIRTGAVTTSKLAAGSVTETILATNAVTVTKIANSTITQAKLNLSTPVSSTDAATKQYVDNLTMGLSWKDAVRLIATSPVATLSGSQTVDGQATAPGDRVLLTAQADPIANGIYIASAVAWVRADDLAAGASAQGTACMVTQGDSYADTQWLCTTDAPSDVVGTNALTFSQFGASAAYSAGNGLDLSGTSFFVKTDGDSVAVSSNGTKAATLSPYNQEDNPTAATTGDNSPTGIVLATLPRGNGVVHVFVNGLRVSVGNGVLTKDAYFSNDGGLTALTYGALAASDELYWNGVIAGYELDTTDEVTCLYQDIV